MECVHFWVEIPTYCWILYMADEVASIFGEKSMLEPMSFESKACWRKEIKFLLSEKIFFSRNCVILIMLISSDFFFSFDDLFDNGNSTKN